MASLLGVSPVCAACRVDGCEGTHAVSPTYSKPMRLVPSLWVGQDGMPVVRWLPPITVRVK